MDLGVVLGSNGDGCGRKLLCEVSSSALPLFSFGCVRFGVISLLVGGDLPRRPLGFASRGESRRSKLAFLS